MSESILREIGSLRGAFDERAQRIDSLRVEVDDHTLRIGRLEGANRKEREP
jgi:hypothetical protein